MKTFKQLRQELDESALDTTMDAVKSGLDSATFGQGKKAIAGLTSLIKGTDYNKELEKEKQRMEKGRERSPKATMAGDIVGGIVNPFAGAYDFGKTAGEMLNKNSTVNKYTDKVGKKIADVIDDSPEVNRAIRRPADYVPQRIKDQQQQQNAKPPLGPVNIKPKVPETKPEQKPVSGDQSAAKPKQDFKSKESIMNIQRELNKRGAKLKVDGIVGKQTAGAVRNLQSDLNKKGAGLKIDGDYGEKTHAALNNQLPNKPKTLPTPDKPKGSDSGIFKPNRIDPNKPKLGVVKLPYKLDPNKPKLDVVKLPGKLDPNNPNGSGLAKLGKDDVNYSKQYLLGKVKLPTKLDPSNQYFGKGKLGKDDGMMPKSLPKTQYKDDGMMPTKTDNANASPFMKKTNYL